MLVACEHCRRQFNKPRCHVERVEHVFCCRLCKEAWGSKKLQKTCVQCDAPFLVRPCEARKFSTCHRARCRRKNKRGASNPNWRGGVTSPRRRAMSTKRYKAWRRAVFERDDYRCVECGKRGGDLNADHIKPWAFFKHLRYDISNGRTLCVPCHRKTYKAVFAWRPKREEADERS